MPNILYVFGMNMELPAAPAKARAIAGGPGFRRAAAAAREALSQSTPDLVVSAGTCGALRPGMQLGEVYSISRIESDLGVFTPQPLFGPTAILRSQDRVAATHQEKRQLAEQGADLVDMEAAAVAAVCQEKSIPFSAIKAVSDLADEDLPLDFNRYRAPDGGFHNARIAVAGIIKIRGLLRIQRQSRLAVEKLGEALAHLF
jgi:adenosylhomocysteine nucleosidase